MNAPRGRRAWRGLFGCVCLAALSGCAPKVDARYAQANGAADALFVRGRYREAGDAWLAAARVASEAADRDEATYRAAGSYERVGDRSRAESLLAGLASGRGERAGRAAFDRARLVSATDPARGETLRLEAIRRHPDAGVAAHALRSYLAGVEARDGEPAALERCRTLLAELGRTELDEALGYECAALSERANDHAAARAGYLSTAERHPYPHGALWDDALAGAARCEERLGRPRAAIETLERMLAERERSVGIGSYERSRYAEARFHIAELYRDALGDPTRARAEFHRVPREHETSLLGDDALFEAGVLEARAGAEAEACESARSLKASYPDSRFLGCASLICPKEAGAGRPCPEATARRFEASAP